MKKIMIVLMVCIALVFTVGCKQKAEEPAPAAPATGPHGPVSPSVMMPKGETKIVVPDSVKAKWSSVVIAVEDKTAKTTKDVTVKLGQSYTDPASGLKITVDNFLPDFRMDGLTITSVSDELNNPAVHIKVFEGSNEIFKGWLYSKFPTIHPFTHDKLALTLKEPVK
ncbi:MAG: DUF2155 domain-containing protein [Nitrospirota bacterium]|nr:MAG: DUF2155 domain-containing protein [Nitrospirota bacterium]